MNVKTLMNLTDDEQKGYVYSSTIFWIAKSEERIEKLRTKVKLAEDDIFSFMYSSSSYLLNIEESNLLELKKFKTKIENGDFDKQKK